MLLTVPLLNETEHATELAILQAFPLAVVARDYRGVYLKFNHYDSSSVMRLSPAISTKYFKFLAEGQGYMASEILDKVKQTEDGT